jgi:RHS repeat-associated protein
VGCKQLQDYFQLVETPILASHKGTKTQGVLFNDMLGTTIGTLQMDKFNSFKRDAFGKLFANSTNNEYNMFTGKPNVAGLGYAFLFRNYRANLGKWQTADPLGYPDGWNNLAYVNNGVTDNIDMFGLANMTTQQQRKVINALINTSRSSVGHAQRAEALLNATAKTNNLADYLGASANTISTLVEHLPDGTPGKQAFETLNNLVSAGNSISQAINQARSNDPRFITTILDASGVGNIPGIGSYIDFINGSINAIAGGLESIKVDLIMQNIDLIDDPIMGDIPLNRIISGEWLVPINIFNAELRRLEE